MARARTKGKDDAPEVVCLVENGRLVPAYPHDAEVLASYSKGAKVFVSMRRQGKRRQHSIWYGLIGDMVKTGQTPWDNAKAADRACRLALDMIEPAKTADGGWISYDASLWDFSDEELDERIELLRALFRKVTGLDPEVVRRELGGGNFDDGYDPPANDAGDETLAGEAIPPVADSEESTSAGPDVPTPAGTGATDLPETATEQRANVLSQREGQSSSEPPEQQRDTLGVTEGETSPQSEPASGGPAPVDEAEAREEPSASSTGELSAEERIWLKQGGKMMLACLPSTDPESLRVLIAQLRIIRDLAPKDVGNACLSRMEIIRLHTTGVCKGQHKLDVSLVAKSALCSVEDVTPEPVKVRDGK